MCNERISQFHFFFFLLFSRKHSDGASELPAMVSPTNQMLYTYSHNNNNNNNTWIYGNFRDMTCKQYGTRARELTHSLTYTLHTSTTSFEHKIINFFFFFVIVNNRELVKTKIWGTAGICYLKLNVQNRQTNAHHSLDTNRENRINWMPVPIYTTKRLYH